MQKPRFLLYGANGYSGRLITQYASSLGVEPILAGRNAGEIEPLARELGLACRVFSLEDTEALHAALQEVPVVLNAAGPFPDTTPKMIEGCLHTGAHYLDISGEGEMFELLKTYDSRAREKGIMIMPGLGFNVVPSDTVALLLKQQMPNAATLELAFVLLQNQVSRGTFKSMVRKLGYPGAVRRQGLMVPSHMARYQQWINIPVGGQGIRRFFVASIPWGDLSTAHTTTGIPNITTYTKMPLAIKALAPMQGLFNWILRASWLKHWMTSRIESRNSHGPDDVARARSLSLVWGRVTDGAGRQLEGTLQGPDPYTITAYCANLAAGRVLAGGAKPGFQTPAGVFGTALVDAIPGVHYQVGNVTH
jgi:short subunit dehydrogenase-like uncharacterized protein